METKRARKPRNEKAAGSGHPSGSDADKQETKREQNSTSTPEASKSAAVTAYLWGVPPLENCQALFARNPRWRAA